MSADEDGISADGERLGDRLPGGVLPARRGGSPDVRYCPAHGEYVARDERALCPRCEEDPFRSNISLRRVRVVREAELAPDALDTSLGPTPVDEAVSCPSCGEPTPLVALRVEAVGEVWDGPAAEFAEEGVCPACHERLAPHLRPWSQAEWLAHHFEAWREVVESVHDIVEVEERAQDAWLPADERPRVVHVERTLSARREHLARAQRRMEELLQRYPDGGLTGEFQAALTAAAGAVGQDAATALLAQRARQLEADQSREPTVEARAPQEPPAPPRAQGPPAWMWAVAVAAAGVALVVGWRFG